ncbi:MAG TPA: chromosome partitioning protein ParA [Desulfobacteraceae bacterium]|nr:chromosome partitioning protein ParA [Desulfobacteraceae bacterium]
MNDNACSAQDEMQKRHAQQDGEIRKRLSHIRNKILVMSGKGGVGKSSVAAYLAVALADRGYRVGLMDVDLHGPSIPRMLGLKGSLGPASGEGKATPVKYRPNMEVMSIETLLGDNKDVATIWRGPLKIGVIKQFLSDLEWMDLDYMILDSPPGTGDEPLTVAQVIPDAKAVIVTTPQEVSLADVRKSINFCRQVNMKILGIVENMSVLICPHCGKTIELFKSHGGETTASKEGLPLLGSLPLDPAVVSSGDAGDVTLLAREDLPFSKAFSGVVDQIIARTAQGADDQPAQSAGAEEKPQAPAGAAIQKKAEKIIALPISEEKLSAHFGHPDYFAFITTDDGKIVGRDNKTSPPHEPGLLPRWLYEQGATVVIAGGMGERAQTLLRQNGIEVIVGAPVDNPETLVKQYLSGSLSDGANTCDH